MKSYGRWELIRSLDEGGQAHVFLVKDSRAPGEEVFVLKRLKNTDDPRRVARFRQEIDVMRGCEHPGILRLVDNDLEASKPYIVTEFCEGGSLEGLRKLPTWPSVEKCFEWFLQICEAVSYAHSKKVIHRDLKPANIFLRSTEGPAVVGDFGLCFLGEGEGRVTEEGEAVGARGFTAPELEGGRLDTVLPECDVYSLGKVLYWLLSTGRVLPRERYRDPVFDLKRPNADFLTGYANVHMEHINRLLDLMICENPAKRRDVDNIRVLARRALTLMIEEYNPVSNTIPQQCTYCGKGTYDGEHFNLTRRFDDLWPSGRYLRLVCTNCGNVQLFCLSRKTEWEPRDVT